MENKEQTVEEQMNRKLEVTGNMIAGASTVALDALLKRSPVVILLHDVLAEFTSIIIDTLVNHPEKITELKERLKEVENGR